jgi:predicted  nucleic acid-binding Zn-ribbon protein
MVRRAEERVHAAEARISDLENQLELMAAQRAKEDTAVQTEVVQTLEGERDAARNEAAGVRSQLAARDTELEALSGELSELRTVHEEQTRLLAEAREDASLFLTDELQTILRTAKDSAKKMMERARADSHRQIEEANRWWEEVKAEVERFGAWREQVEPMLRDIQARVTGVRSSVDAVAARMQEAAGGMQDAVGSIDGGLELLHAAFEVREQGSLHPPDPGEDSLPADAAPSKGSDPSSLGSDDHQAREDGDGGTDDAGDTERDGYFEDLGIDQSAYEDVYDYLA